MRFFEIFSKRQKRLRGEVPDVYQYETIPSGLRVQIIHIWRDIWEKLGIGIHGILMVMLMMHMCSSTISYAVNTEY